MKFNKKQRTVIIGSIMILLAGIFGVDLDEIKSLQKSFFPSPTLNVSAERSQTIKVISVIDGDTFVIEGNQKVRYIGIDTPEIVKDTSGKKTKEECFARESYEENKRLIEGKTVRLERDKSNTDKYGRLLRYVYLDDLFINEHLISQGFARIMAIKPDIRYYKSFKADEDRAKRDKLGLWDICFKEQP